MLSSAVLGLLRDRRSGWPAPPHGSHAPPHPIEKKAGFPPPRQPPPRRARVVNLATLFCTLVLAWTQAPLRAADETRPPEKLEIKPGDHLCLIGNTLADRMQHDGWL